MTTLVVGATGATGRLLVADLCRRGEDVRAIVRSPEKLPPSLSDDPHLTLIQADLLDLDDARMAEYVDGCRAVASCLGHNLTLKGIFGPPRRLVTDAVRRLCQAVKANNPDAPVKFVLMNTTGNRNRDLDEPIGVGERAVVGLLRVVLPPQADNEQAAEVLRTQIGQDDGVIEWVAVRPDGLVDMEQVSEYEIYPSPIRSPIFDAGTTSRINVAHFMADLITDAALWSTWRGRMPVIYNKA